jgi:hypothetical protein
VNEHPYRGHSLEESQNTVSKPARVNACVVATVSGSARLKCPIDLRRRPAHLLVPAPLAGCIARQTTVVAADEIARTPANRDVETLVRLRENRGDVEIARWRQAETIPRSSELRHDGAERLRDANRQELTHRVFVRLTITCSAAVDDKVLAASMPINREIEFGRLVENDEVEVGPMAGLSGPSSRVASSGGFVDFPAMGQDGEVPAGVPL